MKSSALAIAVLALAAPDLCSQDPSPSPDERLQAIERQNREILDRLRNTEARNQELEAEVRGLRATQTELTEERDGGALETQINAISAKYRDGVTFKDLTRSGNPIKFYGFIRFDAYYNTARMNSVIIPAFVLPENDVAAEESNDDEFAMDARLTRFAFDVNAGHIGSADVTGKLETDFANFPPGVTESRETPRIRLAYINLDFGDFTVRLGQDWDTIAPYFPAINNELLMWNAGNLGDRRPQAALIWNTGDPAGTEFELRAAAGFTGAVDALDLDAALAAGTTPPRQFTSTTFDGWDAGHPNGELRMAVTFPSWVDAKRTTLGAWGYVAGLETDARFDGDRHFTPWAVGADWMLPLFGPIALKGELFVGQALSDVRGSIGQNINTATGEEIEGWGGWTEFIWQATDELKLSFGGTIDDVDDGDVAAGGRELNWSLYVASHYNWGGGLKSGLDVIYWETQWDTVGLGNTVRVNFYTQLDF